MKALILVACTLGLTACPAELVATGTAIKVLDLIDEDGTLYSGVVAKGSTTILVTLPDAYKLPAVSTLKDETEFKNEEGNFDEAKFLEVCPTSGTPTKFKMTPKFTLSNNAKVNDAVSQIKNNNNKQVFPANMYLTLSVVNGSKTTTYKVYVGTQAQLDATELVSDPSATQIASFDLYNESGKLSLNTLITHANDKNDDENLITIFLPVDTPRITAVVTQIRLEAPSAMLVSPPSGRLPSDFPDFEPDEPIPGIDSVAGVTYTVYPIGQTDTFSLARTYKVVLKRSGVAQVSLDLIDEDGLTYYGVVKGNTTILVTLPDDYTLPNESTLRGDYETEAAFEAACYKINSVNSTLIKKTLIRVKMTPKLTLSDGTTLSPDSELQNDILQQFVANKYLNLSVLNGGKTTTYKVYVGTQAQLDAVEKVSDPSSTHIASFDLYNANGKLSLNTLITHENDQNDDKNLITIFLPVDTPRITAGFSQISLVSPNTMVVTPVSGTLPADFDPDGSAGKDSVLDVIYKVYPKGETSDFLFPREYKVVLKRTGAEQGTAPEPDTSLDTRILSFDLYKNAEKLSRYTDYTHAGYDNAVTNRVTIVLPLGTPPINDKEVVSQIRLVSPNTMEITPVSGTLPSNFESTEPMGEDNFLDVTYTVYPKGQTSASSSARTYTIVLKRTDAAQGTLPDSPDPDLVLGLQLDSSKLKGPVLVGTTVGTFGVSGTAASRGTPEYTLELGAGDFGTTDDGISKNRDNGKFTITGADELRVGATALPSGFYYIVAKVTIKGANGTPLTEATRAFRIEVLVAPTSGSEWGD
jgi:hypothetical protein